MTDRVAFVAAIAANPLEDAPRLAFADWIEERGDAARAGFIRDQVKLARLPAGSEEANELFRRTAETLKANLPAWIQEICDAFGQPVHWWPVRTRGAALPLRLGDPTNTGSVCKPPVPLNRVQFERGFLEAPEIIPHRIADARPLSRLLGEHPVARLGMLFFRPETRWDWRVPEFNRIRALNLIGPLAGDAARALWSEPDWAALRRVSIESANGELAEALASAPVAKRIESLGLPWNESTLSQLARFPLDDRLHVFRLIPPGGHATRDDPSSKLARLFALPFRPTLKKLDLAGCLLGDRGLGAFARGEVWIRLKSLVLDRNRFGDPGWRDFVRGRRTPELKALCANRNFLTRDGAVRLAQSPLVETLEYLDFRGNRIDGKGAVELARRLVERPLKKLLLAGNPIGDREAATVRKLLGERAVT